MTPDEKEREAARLAYEFLRTDAFERLRNQLELGKALLQSLTLVNGGAIVALFTLIGQQGDNIMIDPGMLKASFGWFIAGLILVIIAGFGGFMSQTFFHITAASQASKNQAAMHGTKADEKAPLGALTGGAVSLHIAAFGAVASLVCFGVGSWYALSGALRASSTIVGNG